jgi:hypothetical protein
VTSPDFDKLGSAGPKPRTVFFDTFFVETAFPGPVFSTGHMPDYRDGPTDQAATKSLLHVD